MKVYPVRVGFAGGVALPPFFTISVLSTVSFQSLNTTLYSLITSDHFAKSTMSPVDPAGISVTMFPLAFTQPSNEKPSFVALARVIFSLSIV